MVQIQVEPSRTLYRSAGLMQIRDKNPTKSKTDVYTNFRMNSNVDIPKQIQTSKEEKTVITKLNELKDLQDMVGDQGHPKNVNFLMNDLLVVCL